MSQVDLRVCLHVCEGKRRECVVVCSDQTDRWTVTFASEELEEEDVHTTSRSYLGARYKSSASSCDLFVPAVCS